MKGLTVRQKQVLDFIKDFIKMNKYPPTIREVATHFSISVKGGYDHIKALEKKKSIKCILNRSRAIEVLGNNQTEDNVKSISLLGIVAAGRPLFAEENFDGEIKIPSWCIGKTKHFALNVKGDSMQDVGIIDGDIAVVRHQNIAENGDIVVALIGDAVTLKRYYREKNRIMLKSENPAFSPIYSRDVKILGKISCIIRKYE